MTSPGTKVIAWVRSSRSRTVVAGILVSALTLVLIGGVILTTTSLGCGPAQKLGLKAITSNCKTLESVAARIGPTPSGSPFFASPSPIFEPNRPDRSPSPTSEPTPPTINPASPSGVYPAFFPPASAPGDPHPLTLSCRLPVFAGPPGSGGFIVFPGATFIADPKSGVVLPSPTSPPPPGYGQQTSLTYDQPFSRWLPVPFTAVSPDGSRYAYVSADSIYMVNVGTGAQVELGQGHSWSIVGVGAQGVYASIVNQSGLWLLPFAGTAQQITTSGFWQQVSTDAAYGTPTSAVPQGAVNNIIRVDLKTGAISDWFTHEFAQSSVVGLDTKGHPIVYVNYFSGGNEIWIAAGPKDALAIAGWYGGNGYYQGFSSYSAPIADSHGIWFAGNYTTNAYGQSQTSGLAVYVAGSGLYVMSNLGAQLAGGCT
jgi:hypothetical protein